MKKLLRAALLITLAIAMALSMSSCATALIGMVMLGESLNGDNDDDNGLDGILDGILPDDDDDDKYGPDDDDFGNHYDESASFSEQYSDETESLYESELPWWAEPGMFEYVSMRKMPCFDLEIYDIPEYYGEIIGYAYSGEWITIYAYCREYDWYAVEFYYNEELRYGYIEAYSGYYYQDASSEMTEEISSEDPWWDVTDSSDDPWWDVTETTDDPWWDVTETTDDPWWDVTETTDDPWWDVTETTDDPWWDVTETTDDPWWDVTDPPEDPWWEESETPEETATETEETSPYEIIITEPDTNAGYYLSLVHHNLEGAPRLYLNGKMNGYYFGTTENRDEAVRVFLETAEDGYYMYHVVDAVKVYINIVKNGTYTNTVFGAEPVSVWNYDATLGTMVTDCEGTSYFLGTRNDKTYSTFSACEVRYVDNYKCVFTVLIEDGEPQCKHPYVAVEGGHYKPACSLCGKGDGAISQHEIVSAVVESETSIDYVYHCDICGFVESIYQIDR